MARLRLRSLWLNIHLWIGVALFLVLAPLGVTGSLLVFDDSLDKVLHPARYAVAAGPAGLEPGVYLDAARTAFAARAVPAQLRMPQGPGSPVTVTGSVPGAAPGQRPTQLTAFIDPVSGKVLDTANTRQEFRGWVHQLHGNLFMAQPGRKLVGWLGVAMLISSITGLIIWWPRNNAVLKALRWMRSPSGFSNLHHMIGFWVCVPLALLSFSGAWIAFPDQARAVSGALRGHPAAAQPRQQGRGGPGGQNNAAMPLAQPQLSAGQAVAAALLAAGGPARVQQIVLPSEGDRPAWRVQLRGEGPPVQVRVADDSGKAKVQPAQPQGPGGGDPIARFMRVMHDGDDTGFLWQAIIVITGLAPAFLGVTGTVIWLTRRRPGKITA